MWSTGWSSPSLCTRPQAAGQVEPSGAVVGVGELDDAVVASQADRLMDVAEAELPGLLAFQLAHDGGRRVQRGRNAALAGAVHHAVALPDCGRVADRVDVRVRYRPQRFVGDDTAAVVDFETGSSRDRGYPHTGRPQHGLRIDDRRGRHRRTSP